MNDDIHIKQYNNRVVNLMAGIINKYNISREREGGQWAVYYPSPQSFK